MLRWLMWKIKLNDEKQIPQKKKKVESFFGRALKASLGVKPSDQAEAVNTDSPDSE